MRKSNRYFLYTAILLFLSLILMRDIAEVAIPGPIVAGFAALFAIMLKKRDLYSFTYFLLPLSVGIPGYTFLLLGITLLVRQRGGNVKQFIPFVILAFLEIFNVAGYDFQYDITGVISFLSFLFLFFLLLFSNDKSIDRRQSLLCYSFGAAFALIIAYLRIIIDSGFAELVAGDLRSGAGMGNYDNEQMMNHLMMNANCIAYYAITLISIAFVFLNRNICNKWLSVLFILIGAASGLLSFSRTWVLLFIVVILWYVYCNNHNLKSILALIFTCGVLFAVGMYSGVLDGIIEVFEFRMENDNIQSAGGRLPLFKAYNEFMKSDFWYILFGTGATYYKQVCHIWNSVHNGTQQIFVSFGIVGLLTYLITVIAFVKNYVKFKVKDNLILFTPFLACFIFVQSIQFLNPYPLMLPFVAAACMIRLNENRISA
jgi:hypothetical protein